MKGPMNPTKSEPSAPDDRGSSPKEGKETCAAGSVALPRKTSRRKLTAVAVADVAVADVAPAELINGQRYLLRLYIAGVTSRSTTAIANLKSICEEHLKGRYELDVVDIYQQPQLARRAQIIAAPTLIRKLPPPLRRIVGDMSQKERVLVGLDLLARQ
jgi:circadian clock protein KaiB